MDAVMDSHSQWVIDQARPPAEAIMNEGRAKDYQVAVNWLKRVKEAYQALGQDATWSRLSPEAGHNPWSQAQADGADGAKPVTGYFKG
jgi:uncharacterized Zn finger protein